MRVALKAVEMSGHVLKLGAGSFEQAKLATIPNLVAVGRSTMDNR